ncbi:MAG TPA: sugar ABC transporter [Micrococcales bacterium]|uniref:ABC transporter permease n=1 Tax=Miniimonas arenae TaxID=676201 RepID=UPI000EE43D41|nr:ABC transporter permease [Miniimonas arenae]HCX85877.1 sugar ABC transporter [Micrococcales bacterium]
MRQAGAGRGLALGTLRTIRDIWAHRELLGYLVRRELKSRYKDSALGFVWSVIRPLVMLLVYYVALGKFLGASRGIDGFAIFIYSGLTLWTLFSEIVTAGTGSIVNNSGLIKKVYLPREIFPIASVGSALFNFAIQFGILIAATVVLSGFPTTSAWWYFPVSLLVIVVWATALALMLSAWNVYLRDVGYLVEVFIMVFFWASPIVYAWSYARDAFDEMGAHWLNEVFLANPVTVAVIGFQQAIWAPGAAAAQVGRPAAEVNTAQFAHPDELMLRLLVALVVGVLVLWIGQRVFARLQANFAQEL